MRARVKHLLFSILGKDPDAIIVCLRSSDDVLSDAMCKEIRQLEQDRRIFEVAPTESYSALRKKFRKYRIGLLLTLLPIPAKAFFLAPRKILAYNSRLERHHLTLSTWIASWLFLKGIPVDRIFLRPWRNDTVRPSAHILLEGRVGNPKRKTVAVLTPYFPYPLSHGGAVRMFNLLREIAREFDVVLYAFTEEPVTESAPVLELCTKVYLVEKPLYRYPRWATVLPPEVEEYTSPAMRALWDARQADLAQVEYTYLARYGGDILVEHDVTFDLYSQIRARRNTLSSWWDWKRWHRLETRVIPKFRSVVVMSRKDQALLGTGTIIENGVDLARFTPLPEIPGKKLLFIGSFRHFPNIIAFRFLTEQILPLIPDVDLTVVAGPDPWLHWTSYTGTVRPPENPSIKILEFVSDIRPLYHAANLVVVPTLESAGTNVKVLEAMSMQRAVISTTSGAAGLSAEHGANIWIADSATDFAAGIAKLLKEEPLRTKIAAAGRDHVQKQFDWKSIGLRQRALLRQFTGTSIDIRPATRDDLAAIAAIQSTSPEASQWTPESYLDHDCFVATTNGRVAGFLVTRTTAPDEREILNIAVNPPSRRTGIARILVETALAGSHGAWYLEVRESNLEAINLYQSLGLSPVGRREKYYSEPSEAAIVMRIYS